METVVAVIIKNPQHLDPEDGPEPHEQELFFQVGVGRHGKVRPQTADGGGIAAGGGTV